MTDIFSKNNITKDEVMAWAMKTYPQFAENEGVVAQLYLEQVKNVTVDPQSVAWLRGAKTPINELEQQKWVTIEGVIGLKVRENIYQGCPTCTKKVDAATRECPEHGEVVAVEYMWQDYMAGDNSGDTIITIPPRLGATLGELKGEVAVMRGVLNDQGNFFVTALSLLTATTEKMEKKKKESAKKSESSQLDETISKFPNITVADLRKWHADGKFTTPLSDLLAEIGFKMEGGKIVADATKAPVVEPEATAPTVTAVPAETDLQIAVSSLTSLFAVFPEIEMVNLKEWFSKQKFKDAVALLDVMKEAGAVAKSDKVSLKK